MIEPDGTRSPEEGGRGSTSGSTPPTGDGEPDGGAAQTAVPPADPAALSGSTSAPVPGPADRRPPDAGGHSRGWWRALDVVTALTAVAALVLAVVNRMELNRRPEMTMTMPAALRVTQHTDGYTIVVQPTFTVHETSELTSVVTDLTLDVDAQEDVSPRFEWVDTAAYVNNPYTGIPDWQYHADPAPLVVTQAEPRNEHIRFVSGEPLPAGRWVMRLAAVREDEAALISRFCVTLSDDLVEAMRQSGAYFLLRNDYTDAGDDSCYRYGRFS